MKNKIITGIDVGTTKIAVIIAESDGESINIQDLEKVYRKALEKELLLILKKSNGKQFINFIDKNNNDNNNFYMNYIFFLSTTFFSVFQQ